jgi:membrane protein DedA with SNARE-associated domain
VAVWTTVGYVSGSNINSIYTTATQYQLYLLIAVVLVLLALILRWQLKRRRARGDRGE